MLSIFLPLYSTQNMECYISDEGWKEINDDKIPTNTYVWGEGFQVDSSQEFSNFTPKKIQAFLGTDTPHVVDVQFGWYHEAYIDSKGELYICEKGQVSSIKVEGL